MQSAPNSPPWVDWLFARLAVRYGDSWFRKWEGLPMADVKRDWQRQLWRTAENNPDALKHALEHLPEFPPTCDAILRLCLQHMPRYERLAAPSSKPNTAFAADVLARLKAHQKDGGRPADAVARRLEARRAAGERLSAPQLAMLQAIAGGSGPAASSEADRQVTAEMKDEAQRRVLAYAQSQGLSLDAEASLRQRNAAHAAWIGSQTVARGRA